MTGLAPHRLAARGLSRTFQNLQIFQRMTASRTSWSAAICARSAVSCGDLFRLPSVTRQNRETRADGARIFWTVVGLSDARGHARRLAALRRAASGSRSPARSPPSRSVLLLDEPAAGCNAVETEEIDS